MSEKQEITCNIVEKLGIISTNSKGWTKELNLVSWNQRAAKYDLREWSPDHTLKGKGLTFSPEEINKLKELLDNL